DLWELWIVDRASGKSKRLAPQFDNWVESFTWAPDSQSIYFTAPDKANVAIYNVSIAGGEPQRLYSLGSAHALAGSRDGATVYFDQSTNDRPNDIFAMHQVSGGWRSEKITHDNDTLLAQLAMGAMQDVWYAGAEGAQVQALMVLPPNFDKSKKAPAVVLIHGG